MIRYAKVEDVNFIYKLSKENLATSFTKETLIDYIKQKQTYHVFVCEEEDLIGFIILWESDQYGQIIDLVIRENKRSLGYGKMMIEKSFDFFLSKNVKSLTLEVSVNNDKAIKLYEKMGFMKEKVIHNYYDNVDGILYVRRFEKWLF